MVGLPRASGFTQIAAETAATNTAMQKALVANGFGRQGQRRHPFDDGADVERYPFRHTLATTVRLEPSVPSDQAATVHEGNESP
jgi:hypothetical protein